MSDLISGYDPSETTGNVSLRPRVSRLGTAASTPKMPAIGTARIDGKKLYTPSPAGTGDQDLMCRAPHPVMQYIIDEMRTNSQSDEIKAIRALRSSNLFGEAYERFKKAGFIEQFFMAGTLEGLLDADMKNHLAGSAKFGCMVADARAKPVCGEWDHKPKITAKGWGVAQLIDFNPLGYSLQMSFYYDIWSNIHYGFVGRAASFSEEYLLKAAATENKISNLGGIEPVSDRTSIQIGMDLYRESGLKVDMLNLLSKLYLKRDFLHQYDPKLPQKDRVFTNR